ncbi:thiol-disulfide isomerase/thioredoxin [Pedobacter cryoconitis]|uniref:TlpA disulfide reductase family protein n=1 Tax=Pedobacter cryoconitis TaxID=188932 RepID=UPI00161AF45A|nr:TlpA disulfide reductase family protein [Pedobacter cryoconitis]MBB6270903.1 thiol-disulfide isomerase/thioredoxin [Pedobacter cryoconitis]
MKKNIFLAIILSLYSIVALAQQTNSEFTLVGTFTGTPISRIEMTYPDSNGKRQVAIDTLNKNTFIFKGNIKGVTVANFVIKPAKQIEASNLFDGYVFFKVFLEPNKMTLIGDVANMVDMEFTGSETQREYKKFLPDFWPVRKRLNSLMAAYYAEKDLEKQKLLARDMLPTQKQMIEMAYKFCTEHPKSVISADLAINFKLDFDFDSLKLIYENLSSEAKTSSAGRLLAYEIKRVEAGSPGSNAIFFSKKDINGNPISLSEFKGKYVLLDFWASWCIPCREGNPHLLELYKRYKGKGFEIIGISDNDRNPIAWKEAVKKDEIGVWRHILRGHDATLKRGVKDPNDLSELYGVDLLPTKILIDPNGKIIARYKNTSSKADSSLDKMLASIFK